VQVAVIVWLLLGIAWTAVLRRRSPQLFKRRSQVFETEPAEGELAS